MRVHIGLDPFHGVLSRVLGDPGDTLSGLDLGHWWTGGTRGDGPLVSLQDPKGLSHSQASVTDHRGLSD